VGIYYLLEYNDREDRIAVFQRWCTGSQQFRHCPFAQESSKGYVIGVYF